MLNNTELQTILEFIDEGVMVFGTDFVPVYMNKSFLNITGLKREHIERKEFNLTDIFPDIADVNFEKTGQKIFPSNYGTLKVVIMKERAILILNKENIFMIIERELSKVRRNLFNMGVILVSVDMKNKKEECVKEKEEFLKKFKYGIGYMLRESDFVDKTSFHILDDEKILILVFTVNRKYEDLKIITDRIRSIEPTETQCIDSLSIGATFAFPNEDAYAFIDRVENILKDASPGRTIVVMEEGI